ncbi:MAG: hypothetical protein ABSD75_28815 [Terriglobales bacterium]
MSVGAGNQFMGGGGEIAVAERGFGHFSSADSAVQSIGAEQQDIAGQELDFIDVDVDEKVHSQGTTENVALVGLGGLFGGEQAEALLLGCDGVIAGDGLGISGADQVATRIADVRDGGAVEAQRAGNDGRSHAGPGAAGEGFGFADAGVGGLHDLRQDIFVKGSFFGPSESGEYFLNGGARRDFALALATDTIGKCEEPSVGTGLRGGTGSDVAEIVLIARAHAANVGEFGEFKIQHAKLRRTAAGYGATLFDFGMRTSYRNIGPEDCVCHNG